MKTYRGSPTAARAYVEGDRSRADDYYLAEGSGVAMRFVAGRDELDQGVEVRQAEDMDGATYESWVAGFEVRPCVPRGVYVMTSMRSGSSK